MSKLFAILVLIVVLQCAVSRKIVTRRHAAEAAAKSVDAKCVVDKCQTELKACVGDTACSKVVKDCSTEAAAKPASDAQKAAYVTCIEKDAKGKSLWECVSKTANGCIKRLEQHLQLAALIAEHKEDKEVTCLKKNCGTQIEACRNDSNCTGTIKDCASKVDKNDKQALTKFESCLEKNPAAKGIFKCFKTNCMQGHKFHRVSHVFANFAI